MRILFFVPNGYECYGCKFLVYPPLGPLYLASIARNLGHTVTLIDAETKNMKIEQALSEIVASNPDIVAISVTTPYTPIVADVVCRLKKLLPHTRVVVGGPHPSARLEKTFEDIPFADFAIYGEGEEAFSKLIECFEGNSKYSDCPSLIYLNGDGTIAMNEAQPMITDVDSIPFPAYDFVAPWIHLYPATFPSRAKPSLHIMASRGCPFNCSFCSNAVFGRKTRFRSVDSVLEEVEFLHKEFKVREIFFQDDTFNCRLPWLTQLCEKLIHRGLNKQILFKAPFRVDRALIKPEIMKLVKEAGFWMIFYGVESGDQEMLDHVSKGTTVEEIKRAFEITRRAGLHTHASFMVGNIGETRDTVAKSLELFKSIVPDTFCYSVAMAFPGTEFYHEAVSRGYLVDTEPIASGYPNIGITRTEVLTREEISKLTKEVTQASYDYQNSPEAMEIVQGCSGEEWEFRRFYMENKTLWCDYSLIGPLDLKKRPHFQEALSDSVRLGETTGLLGEGWLTMENWPPTLRHFGKRGRIYLKRTAPNHNAIYMRVYSGYPLINEDPIGFSVSVNGAMVGRHIFCSHQWYELNFPLPSALLDDDFYDILLEVDRTWCPDDFNKIKNDPRTLSVAVECVGLTETKQNIC